MMAGVLAILGVAAWLRFADLSHQPLHFDEAATGARSTADRLELGRYVFNPQHGHGPLLSMGAAVVARLRGETSWNELTKFSLRLSVALCSLLTVAGALLIGRRTTGLAAAALVATSPLLVYYGRIFIHESVFVAFGLLTLLSLTAFLQRPRILTAAVIGIGVGLMAATRETFVISLVAWGVPSIVWLWTAQSGASWRQRMGSAWTTHGRYLLLSLTLGVGVIALLYSDLGRHPKGAVDFVRTYFTYSVVEGHEKPFRYFFEMLLWPRVRGGLWWSEGGILLLAIYGYIRCPAGRERSACRFIAHGGVLHLLIYSIVAYKTPWLACLGWMHVCLVAGYGVVGMLRDGRTWWRIPVMAALVLVLSWQCVQTRRAIFRFASDMRNPYAYVPTSRDTERMSEWLDDLAQTAPMLDSMPVTVVGDSYWPLPWYLRGFTEVGYYDQLPADAGTRALILIVSSREGPDSTPLEATHLFFPRGLRNEVLVTVAIRRDIWDAIQAGEGP
jgi:uncharacterized protein (TIGR03663 family)